MKNTVMVKCSKCEVMVGIKKGQAGVVYCTTHAPVSNTTNEGAVHMTNENNAKERLQAFLFGTKEQVAKMMNKEVPVTPVGEDVVSSKNITPSGIWDTIMDASTRLWAGIKKHALLMSLTLTSVVVAGAHVAGSTAAILLGGGVALATLIVMALMKKKEDRSIRDTATQAGVILATALLAPLFFELFTLVSVYVAYYGGLVPFSYILA